MNSTEHRYPSGEGRSDLFTGVASFIFTLGLIAFQPEWWPAALLGAALCVFEIWRGVRSWGHPYVELGEDKLVVFDRGHPKHRVQLETVASVRQRFNRTVFALRDGTEVPISHWNFVTSDDARDFNQKLAARLETAGG